MVVVSLSGFRTAAPLASAEVPAADMSVIDEFVHTVNWVAESYGTGPIQTVVAPLPDPNTFAIAMGQQITLNSVYTDKARLTSAIQHNIDVGWIPGGCSPAATVALHEAAHIIDNVNGKIGTKRVAATYRLSLPGPISGYSYSSEGGNLNAGEAVASAFQSVLCNGGTEAEKDMYLMLVQP
jgi:hypothetical protein